MIIEKYDRKQGLTIYIDEPEDGEIAGKRFMALKYRDAEIEQERREVNSSMCPHCHLSRSRDEVAGGYCESCGADGLPIPERRTISISSERTMKHNQSKSPSQKDVEELQSQIAELQEELKRQRSKKYKIDPRWLDD